MKMFKKLIITSLLSGLGLTTCLALPKTSPIQIKQAINEAATHLVKVDPTLTLPEAKLILQQKLNQIENQPTIAFHNPCCESDGKHGISMAVHGHAFCMHVACSD